MNGGIINKISILRPLNLCIVGITQYLFYFIFFISYSRKFNIDLLLEGRLFHLFVASTIIITLCGYLINDFFDYEKDLIYKDKPFLNKKSTYLKFYFILNITAFIICLYIAFTIQKLGLLSFFFISTVILYFYSSHLKSIPFAGNCTVAIFTSMVILILFIFEFDFVTILYQINTNENLLSIEFKRFMYPPIFFAVFSFLTNWIREIIKDYEDRIGDKNSKITTFANSYSDTTIKKFLLTLGTVNLLLILFFAYSMGFQFEIIQLSIFMIGPAVLFLFFTFNEKSLRQASKLSAFIKLQMLLALIFIFITYY